MRDVIVILPGILGSVLRKDGRDVWALSGSAILAGLKTLGRSIDSLALTGDSADAETLDDGITADRVFPDTHLLPGLWKIDGYSTLAREITTRFDARVGLNYFEFPYDWRRDNRAAARRLSRLSSAWLRDWRARSGYHDAKLILLAHSMGGLVARYFLEALGGWRDTRALITFGTPYRGSLNALSFLANGLKKAVGPLTLVDLSRLVRSFTSVYQLLPIYPCYDVGNGDLRRIGEVTDVPNVDVARVRAALDFHNEIRLATEANEREDGYREARYTLHPIVGTYQPTLQVARRAAGGIELFDRYPGLDLTGDGTVPQVSATPIESEALTAQHHRVYVAEIHGSLQNSRVVLDHLVQLLAEGSVPDQQFRAIPPNAIGIVVDDLYSTSERASISVRCADENALLTISVASLEGGREVRRTRIDQPGAAARTVDLGFLEEGTYRVRVERDGGGSVTDVFVVMQG